MIVALSYVLAVVMTAALAIILYPIAAAFWVFGLLGKLSDGLFDFTKRTIGLLWKDLKNSEQAKLVVANQLATRESMWTCSCGYCNEGRFCSNCGAAKTEEREALEEV